MRFGTLLAVCVALLPLAESRISTAEEVKITPEVQRQIASALGLDPRSSRVTSIVSSFRQSQKPGPPPLATPEPTPAPILKYIRGKEGTPFALPLPPLESRVNFDEAKPVQEKALEEMTREFQRQITPVTLPRCESSSTKKTRFKKVGPKDRRVTAFDLLVVASEKMPIDGEEIFGSQPLLVSYQSERAHGGSLAALGIGVDCLPFRVRVTSGGTYIHRGLDALRDFDVEADGEGRLDERAVALWESMR